MTEQGMWVSYHPWPEAQPPWAHEIAVFATEIEALRHAVKWHQQVAFKPFDVEQEGRDG